VLFTDNRRFNVETVAEVKLLDHIKANYRQS